MNQGIIVIGFALTFAAGLWAWRGVEDDPRRLSNAARIALPVVVLAVALTLAGSGTAVSMAMLLMVLSPLLAVALAIFLLWNGSQMLRREGRSLGNLLSLLAGLAIIGAIVIAFGLLTLDPHFLPLSLWLVLCGGWVAALFFGFLGYSTFYQHHIGQPQPDYIVTLGSGLIGDRVPPLLAGRIDRAISLYRAELAAGRHPVLVMSGGKGSDEKCSEAEVMARYATDMGVDADDLLQESASTTTEQNLRFTRQLVAVDPRLGEQAQGVAVTSNFHAMRAAMLARRIGVPMDVIGAPTAGYFWPSAVLREFVAVVRDSLVMQVVCFALVTLPLPLAFAYAIFR